MSGYEKAKQVADNLKAETKKEEENKLEARQQALTALEQVKTNSSLAKMYEDSATLGSENLASGLPILKVHVTGKSTANQLSNGEEPNNGWFYYKPTREQFETITCHILTISKGFRAPHMNGKPVFTQLLGGVITNDGTMKPFIMYVTGTKLQGMWDFGKQASLYTKSKVLPIPMFALLVELSTKQTTTSFGKSWVIDFSIVKDESMQPKLVLDEGEFQFLKDNVSFLQETMDSLIEAKTSSEKTEAIDGEAVETREEDIPFS